MSTKQQEVLAKAEETSKAGFILTKNGVMIVGHDFLGDKLTAIIWAAIEQDDLHGLLSLVIRTDDFPIEGDSPVFGMAYADTHSVAVNLEHCWHRACVKASKDEENLSFLGILWVNVLSTLAHELDHLTVATNDRVMYELMRSTEDGQEELEKSGNAAGEPMIIALAKQFDIEIPQASELGWFGVKLMDLFTDESTKDLEWVVKARKDIEAGIIYAEPENKIEIKTFREFVKRAYDLNSNDEAWEQPTTAVNLSAELESGEVEVFKAEPVKAPEVALVVLEEEASGQAAEAAVAMVANAAGMFVGAGEEGEPDIRMADGIDSEGQPTIDMIATQAGLVDKSTIVDSVMAAQAVVDADPSMEVPLPAPVAAVQAATTAAAATATPPVKETPTTYAPHNLSPEIQAATMKAIWQVLYHHIFTKCGWQQNPQTGRFMFTNAAAVLEGVNVQNIIAQLGADNFIMEYDTLSAEGQYTGEMFQGMIRGRTTSKQGLPSYALYLNINGQRTKRTFMPQNPEKRNAQNAYTNSADLAGAGHMIAWVFKDEVPDAAPFAQKCSVTIKDNVYEVMS